jgi:plastocyanin
MRRGFLAAATLAIALWGAAPASSQHGTGGPGGTGSAPGGTTAVSIGFAAVAPQRIDVVRGDTVRWTNDSVRTHTVTADDLSFDSGRVIPRDTYTRMFDAVGETPYHCVLHPSIRGVVAVHNVLLTAPPQAAAPGRPFPLSGRAALPAGTQVAIEADHGTGFTGVSSATVGFDGSFVGLVVPDTTATYRAVAGADASPPVNLLVLDRRISVRAERGRRTIVVHTRVTPSVVGAPVVLQFFLHDHFGWWPVQRARLDRTSTARFRLRVRRRVAVRVLQTLPDGATPLAISRTIRLGPTR